MNETLKGVAHIGAELAAAKADLQREMERHRKTWRQLDSLRDVAREALAVIERLRPEGNGMGTIVRLKAALSQQAEPLEPAPAQDERDSVIAHIELCITNLKAEHQTNPRVIAEVLYNIGYSRATRPAQTEQQPEQSGTFAMHQQVRKISGSEWEGHICGTYSTELTPEGYAVESAAHRGSVQIYPAKALELVPSNE